MSFDITYYSFNDKRADEAWIDKGDKKIEKLAEIYKNINLLEPENIGEVKAEIKNLDLEIGGVRNSEFAGAVIIEESKCLIVFLTALHKVFGLVCETETVTKENLVYIYKNLASEKINEAAQLCAEELGYDFESAKTALVSLLIEMKPVVNDLLKFEDSRLYVDYHNSIDGEPKEVEDFLNKRAETLFEKYKSDLTLST